jgi:hypothetical protein
MFQALGRAVTRNPDTTFTVRVEITDDRTGTSVGFRSYTVASKPALMAAILADLQALKAAENDATLNAAIVGQLLGQI